MHPRMTSDYFDAFDTGVRKPVNGYFPKETVEAVLAVAPDFSIIVETGRYRVWAGRDFSYELTLHTELVELGPFWDAVRQYTQDAA